MESYSDGQVSMSALAAALHSLVVILVFIALFSLAHTSLHLLEVMCVYLFCRTIILSVISILNEPNISSPANVDASVAFRKWKAGEDMAYERRVRTEVAASKKLAEDEGLNIPLTMEEYLNSSISDKYVMCPEGKVQLTSASSRSVRIGREWMPLPTSQRTKTTTMIRTWET
eukprot:TRINITY_DN11416_c3_g2_i4.p1 TRINITY_DN11416_c3_g2~~TRINITY_DN11416_c3_g2_i4.p1  ORF type:complete len:172 (+),score=17.20 TRINITY_DN11416_c3_g2_i4:699-1214(+)